MAPNSSSSPSVNPPDRGVAFRVSNSNPQVSQIARWSPKPYRQAINGDLTLSNHRGAATSPGVGDGETDCAPACT